MDNSDYLVELQDNGMSSEEGRKVSEQEYWEKYYEHPDFNYEWNNGILEEVPVSNYLSITMYEASHFYW